MDLIVPSGYDRRVSREGEEYELEDLVELPGTYFNPRSEVVIVVDDSASVDQEAFDLSRASDPGWIRVTDEIPIDEQARDEALEAFQADFHAAGGGSLSATALDQEDEGPDGDEDGLDPDEEDGDDSGSEPDEDA